MTDSQLIQRILEELKVLNDEYAQILQRLASLEAKVEVLMWAMCALVGAIIIGAVSIWFRKNNRS